MAAREAAAVVRLVAIGATREWDTGPLDESTSLTQGVVPQRAVGTAAGWMERTAASGFVLESDGYILTNAHAVADAQEVWVLLADDRRLRARVLGWDRQTDVALLKVAATGLPSVTTTPSARPCAGEWVAAMGAPFGFEHSVTVGVVSAQPRYLPGMPVPLIQSDVALNPGSSGGPLFNARGQVIGMNSMVYSATGGYIGVSFSVPIDVALRVAAELRTHGRVRRSQIGVRVQPLTPELAQAFSLAATHGALVLKVEPAGPAFRAGLRTGDVLLRIDGAAPDSHAGWQERIAAARAGQRLQLDVWRSAALLRLEVLPQDSANEMPPPAEAPAEDEPRFGLSLADRPERAGGQLPAGLYAMGSTGAARRAGLQAGDRVLAVNERAVTSLAEFDAALARRAAGAPVALLVQRGSALSYVAVGAVGPGLLPGE